MTVMPTRDPLIKLSLQNVTRGGQFPPIRQNLTVQPGPGGLLGLVVSDTDMDPGMGAIGLDEADRRALAAVLMEGLD